MSDIEQEVVLTQPTSSSIIEDEFSEGSQEISQTDPETSAPIAPESGVIHTPQVSLGHAASASTPRMPMPIFDIEFEKWKFEQELREKERQRKHEEKMFDRKVKLKREEQEAQRQLRDHEIKTMHAFQIEQDKKKELKGLTISEMTDDCKVDTYLENFEKLATTCKWDKSTWVVRLVPKLRGQAADAYHELDSQNGTDYDALKTAILAKYQLNAETYRRQFRSLTKADNQTVTTWVSELSRLYFKWIAMTGIKITKEALTLAHC